MLIVNKKTLVMLSGTIKEKLWEYSFHYLQVLEKNSKPEKFENQDNIQICNF